MLVYHGGYCEISRPELKPTANHKDFGSGFYCTGLLPQAERRAKRFPEPVVNCYEYTENSTLDLLQFDAMTENWLDFIIACRNGVPHRHDIVAGSMANDQIWNYVADFISGILTREQFWILAKFKHPTHQIVFCTEKALQCLQFKESIRVKK